MGQIKLPLQYLYRLKMLNVAIRPNVCRYLCRYMKSTAITKLIIADCGFNSKMKDVAGAK